MSFLTRWWNRPSHRQATARPRRTPRLWLEALEDRVVPTTVYALNDTNQILRLDDSAPTAILGTVTVSGLSAGEFVVGIDFRPRTGQLYGLVVNGNGLGTGARLVTINPLTGVSAQVGAGFALPMGADAYGFDFNPTVDLIRVNSSSNVNLRLNPNTGAIAGTDPVINPPGQAIDSAAYDRNFDGRLGANGTTLYVINTVTGMLQTQGGLNQVPSPNTGMLINVGPLVAPIDPNSFVGFDIQAAGAAQQGNALATWDFTAGAPITTGLYRMNLATGAGTFLGLVGSGAMNILGLAIVPNSTIVTATNGGTVATINVVDAFTGQNRFPAIVPFPGFTGSLAVATADVNRDSVPDVITVAQATNGHVQVFNGATGAVLFSFFAFEGFSGTFSVAGGDVNGDGFNDIIVSANSNAHVKAFSGQNLSLLSSFFAFPGFFGIPSLGAGDFNNDGTDEIIVGAGGAGSDARVAIFNANGTVFNAGFFAFPGFIGTISVAGGDVNGDGIPEVAVAAGPPSTGAHTKTFTLGGTLLNSFFAYEAGFAGGASVALADVNQDGRFEIITSPLSGRPTEVRAFDALTQQQISAFFAFPGSGGANIAGART